jgi:hypothetical protein
VLWTHNDSGNPARIYAIGPDGGTVDTVKISGTLNRDWEAIAAFRDRSGRPLIALGDIGDNNEVHPDAEIVIIAEPTAGQTRARPLALLHVRYPTGPVNAEALLVDPTSGRMYLVTKELLGGRVFELPAAVWPGGSTAVSTLQQVGTVSMGLVTDGVFLPDGRMVLRNYSAVEVLAPPAGPGDAGLTVLASQDTPTQDQGESVTLADGGTALLVGSEGKKEPVYRIALPVTVSPSLTGSAGPPSSSAPATGSRPVVTAAPTRAVAGSGSGGAGSSLWVAPLVAAGGTALAFAAAIALNRRRTRR